MDRRKGISTMWDGQPGDSAESVEATYRRLAPELWARLYAHCCDAHRAHDAVHEAFMRLQQQDESTIRDRRAWLLQVGMNWLRDVARRQQPAVQSAEYLDHLTGLSAEPSAVLEEAELRDSVRWGLNQLRPDDREVLVLRYALGWSSNRIAAILETTSQAVDMRLSRARLRLGELLERAGIGHESI